MNIKAIKEIVLDRILDIDEAVALSAEIRNLELEYLTIKIPAPEWLVKASETLRTEIARRVHSNDLAELQRLEAQLDSYKSVNERRDEVQSKLAALQSKLGMGPRASKRVR